MYTRRRKACIAMNAMDRKGRKELTALICRLFFVTKQFPCG